MNSIKYVGAILGSSGGMIGSMYWPFFFSMGGKHKKVVLIFHLFNNSLRSNR